MQQLVEASSRGQVVFTQAKTKVPSLTLGDFALGIVGKDTNTRRDASAYLAVHGDTDQLRLYGLALYMELKSPSTPWWTSGCALMCGGVIGILIYRKMYR